MSDELIYVPSVVPVFPLPGVVLFPHTFLPLHIFEPRYRAMMADAIEGEKIIAVATLQEGWEPLYHTLRAPIHPVIGIGRIAEHEELSDGNYNLLLRGVGRARVLENLSEPPYRTARIEPFETFCSANEAEAQRLRATLFDTIKESEALETDLRTNWLKLRDLPLELDQCVDMVAAGLPGAHELRQCVLSEADAARRVDMVITQIKAVASIARNLRRYETPAAFSLN